MYEISAVYARVVLRHLNQQNLPLEPFFAGTALTSARLHSEDSIAMEDFLSLLRNAARLPDGDATGLVIGRHSNVMTLGAVGAAVAAAPSLGDALRAMESFSRLHASYVRVELVADLQGLCCHISYLQDLGATRRFHTESAVSLMQNHIEAITGRRLDDGHYAMDFPQPGYVDRYPEHFHSPVSFGHERCTIFLPAQWLTEASPYYHAEIWQQGQLVLAQRVRERDKRSDSGYGEHIRALLRSHLPPLPGLESIASALHMSPRTLNRRLQEEGTTFRELRAGVVHDRAKLYLRESGLSVEAIAAELDYQDAANFRRAFRLREGCSPATWREDNR